MLFKPGEFTSHSGLKLDWKIECDALDGDDWAVLAHIIALNVMPFNTIVGIPRGGLQLAEHLRQYKIKRPDGITLIVDDVLTTGGSIRRAYEEIAKTDPECLVRGAVAFARGPCPTWVFAVWQSG